MGGQMDRMELGMGAEPCWAWQARCTQCRVGNQGAGLLAVPQFAALHCLSVPIQLVHPERGSVPSITVSSIHPCKLSCPPHCLSPSIHHPPIHPSQTALGPPVPTSLACYLGCPCLCRLSIHPRTLFCPSHHAMRHAVCLSMPVFLSDSCPVPPLFLPPCNAPSCPSSKCCLSIRPVCSASPSHAP